MFDASRQIVHHQSRAYARQACEGALQRLGTDYIDLFTLRGPVQVCGVIVHDVGILMWSRAPPGGGGVRGWLLTVAAFTPSNCGDLCRWVCNGFGMGRELSADGFARG
jgi:hypothetical protein